MTASSRHTDFAKAYAKAILDQASERKPSVKSAEVVAGLAALCQSLEKIDSRLIPALGDPRLDPAERMALADIIITEHKLPDPIPALLYHLTETSQGTLLPSITEQAEALVNKRDGKIDIVITTAEKTTTATQKKIRTHLDKALAGADLKSAPEFANDPTLMGGMQIRIESVIVDDTVSGRLNRLRQNLTGRQTNGH